MNPFYFFLIFTLVKHFPFCNFQDFYYKYSSKHPISGFSKITLFHNSVQKDRF
jgi:hypothetical protein